MENGETVVLDVNCKDIKKNQIIKICTKKGMEKFKVEKIKTKKLILSKKGDTYAFIPVEGSDSSGTLKKINK